MTKVYDIIAFADTCVDLILRDDDIAPRFGQVEKLVADYELVMGGSCCIFATQAAKLGLQVALLGSVGDDVFGRLILDTLKSAGVDTRHMLVDKKLRTGVTVHMVQGDDRAMLTYPGSSNALTAAEVSAELLSMARHLHYGSLFLQAGLFPHWIDLLKRAKGLGLTVSLDTNWDPSAAWNINIDEALPLVDVLLPNEQEAMRLSDVSSLAEATESLRKKAPVLAVKRGSEGASVWTSDLEARQTVIAADAGGDGIGAGDSFDAGFLAGWLNGLGAQDCLSIACQCGRAVAGQVGGIKGQPTRSDIQELTALERG